ncbi:MAG TPA: immunoglobulin domain-containing protein [Candidatus Didemnitutus sp.]|nr:immunoglobulin domain-containing protein [Candidatus Didemnitutus sp.]
MKMTTLFHRHSRWINFPAAILIFLLQRTPILNLLVEGDEFVMSSPAGTLLKSLATTAVALGAVNSMAGATPLTVSSGTSTGVSLAAGTAGSVSISLAGADNTADPPASWTVSGAIPPGMDYSGLTSSGTANVMILHLEGTPTTAGSYMVSLQVFSDPNATGTFQSAVYSYTVTVTGSTATAPSISTQPTGQSVTAGNSANFTGAASGSPTPTLQWQRQPSGSGTFSNVSNGGAYSGATTGTLTVSGTTTDMSGDQFRLVATNSAGSATSNAATLTVNATTAAPAFTTQPTNQTVTAGGSASFVVAASGGPAPTLQWQRQPSGGAFANLAEGGGYTGTTGTTLTVSNTVVGMTGDQFRCVATNGSGSATSNAASLTVNPAPVINSISYDSTDFPGHALPGATINFTYHVTNTGTNAWGANHYLVVRDTNDNNLFFASLNGIAPGGGTTASLTLTAPSTPGSYTFYVQGLENNVAYFATRATLMLTVSLSTSGIDLNGDGKPDLIWSNTATGDRAIWFMNGTNLDSFGYLAGISTDWKIVGVGDFNGDGQADLVWENTSTGDRTFWLMNGTTISSFGYLAQVDTAWHIAAIGDFNGDGQNDVIWENTTTGDRAVWFLNGMNILSFGYIAGIDPAWHIVGAADIDGDGKTDLLWENRTTGDRTVWFMNGATLSTLGYIANIPGDWHVADVVDIDSDGRPDLVWENTTTGDRAIWLMNGVNLVSAPYLAGIDPVWSIAP